MKFKKVCVVPARGGSKGLPGKNLKIFNGETLVRGALRKAVLSSVFDLVVLTSDDDAILTEGKFGDVQCHRRSATASSDFAPSEAALREVLDSFGINSGLLTMIQCTTPLLECEDISAAVKLADRPETCSVVSGYVENMHHWILSDTGTLKPVGTSQKVRQARQDAKLRIFVENGGIYVTSIEAFLKSGNRFNGRIIPYIMDEERSIDIDTAADLDRLK